MPPKADFHYDFRDVTEADLPMLSVWLAEPYVAEWWGDGPDAALAEIVEAMGSDSTEPLIVELNGKPIGYAQSYDPHLEDDHPYQDQPFGTLGIDVTIGVPGLVGIGHGSRLVSAFVGILFEEGCPRVIVDPHPDNRRAIRAYEKAGFQAFGERTSKYGPALMMVCDAQADE